MEIFSIRGAVTAERDGRAEIFAASAELFNEIAARNGFTENKLRVLHVFCSTTADITAAYPAEALRKECGLADVPLFSSLEPPINNSLPLCIRLLVTVTRESANKEQPALSVRHVYLRGAQKLRPDLVRRLNIAIDGPAGAGKSTVAEAVAEKLGIMHLDTGAMYRAVALKACDNKIPLTNDKKVGKMLENTDVKVTYGAGGMKVFLDGKDVTRRIREPRISQAASDISALPAVRLKMAALQRAAAQENDLVLDGRDIGTFVLPDARYKFFLTASAEKRAERRCKELKEKGHNADFETVLADIVNRDKNDSERALAPLKQADDAALIDSTDKTAEEVTEIIINKVKGER